MRTLFAAKAFGLLWVTWSAVPAFGSLIVNVDSYSVTAGTPITAQLTVSNTSDAASSDIEGMTFTVQIADGAESASKIASVDLLTGSIWSGAVSPGNIGTPVDGDQLQYQSRDLLTDNPGEYADANGLLATVTFDTTGAAPGDYAIELIGTMTAGRDSEFLDGFGDPVTASFGQGNITITVPEPSTLLLLLSGFGAYLTAACLWQRFAKKSRVGL